MSRLNIRTKFTNLDGLLKHDGMNRVRFQMNFNTPYAIQEFEPNSPPLADRIKAFRKMQEAEGYRTEVVIEPIIPYAGHRQDYIELVETILAGVHKDQISAFSVGAVRFKVTEGSLPKVALRNFPDTKLLITEEKLQKAERKDGRQRYPIDWRVSIYKELIDTFKRQVPDASIKIGADVPEVWDRLNLDVKKYLANSVFQSEGNGNVMTTRENKTDPTHNDSDKSETKNIDAQSAVTPPVQALRQKHKKNWKQARQSNIKLLRPELDRPQGSKLKRLVIELKYWNSTDCSNNGNL